ncbi:MAG: AAA family ATPase [Thalassobaculum sp.]
MSVMVDSEDDVVPLRELKRKGGRKPADFRTHPNNVGIGQPKPLRGVAAAELVGRDIRPPKWWLEGFIYAGAVGCMYAPGGTGKSYIILQMAVASALGHSFCGVPTTPGRTVIFSCEDDLDVVHARLDRIVRSVGHKMSDLEDRIIIYDRTELENTMLYVGRDFELTESKLWRDIIATCERDEPNLVVIDGLWNVYDGPENNRSMAYKAVTKFKELPHHMRDACDMDTALMFTAHPSLSGQQSGSGTSGSTAWNGAFRFRLLLERPDAHGGERNLRTMKQNYGSDDGAIALIWDDDAKVYLPDNPEIGTVARLRREGDRKRLIDTIWKLLREGRRLVDTAKHSPNYYTKIIKSDPFFKTWSEKRLQALVEEALEHKELRIGTVKDASRRLQSSIVPHNWDDSEASS